MLDKVGELVLLDYLGKAVRQAPSRCIFAGDKESRMQELLQI